MGVMCEDVVVLRHGRKAEDPSIVTISCPDETGLGSNFCRIVLEFGLRITKADVSTDGRWCYVIFWVVPMSSSVKMRWSSLKQRLLSICPSYLAAFYLEPAASPKPSQIYLLKFLFIDRRGLLHDVTQVLCDLELRIHRVKVSTMPDGRVMDLFFVTDGKELLHTKKRQVDTCERLGVALGESCLSCEIHFARPEYDGFQQCCSLSPSVAEELFTSKQNDDTSPLQALTLDLREMKATKVNIDNSLSPAHTLLQIQCVDQKSLLYDIARTLKDFEVKIVYIRFSSSKNGFREVDLFVQKIDGKKILDPIRQSDLCSRLKIEMLHPLRVLIASRGPDTELLVANPVELSGNGRPRVFYDVTVALKTLGISIFLAETGRLSASSREWEVYRFLLDEKCEFPLNNKEARAEIVERVKRSLMGR